MIRKTALRSKSVGKNDDCTVLAYQYYFGGEVKRVFLPERRFNRRIKQKELNETVDMPNQPYLTNLANLLRRG